MLPTGEEDEVIFPVKDGNQRKDARGSTYFTRIPYVPTAEGHLAR